VISVRTNDGHTNDFLINIVLHQGSALSPYHFALMMVEVTREETYKAVSLGVCSFRMMSFWRMRVEQGLTRCWICGAELWRQKVLDLVSLKQSI
jgi:hypothetical protein